MLNPCRSNLLPILITLLSCAGLFIFFNLRLNELKITVEKQNRVLTSFITNVQHDIKASGGAAPQATEPTKHFAAPEALIAARRQEMDKIVVSDDEEDSDDSESESDSDSESDGEDANDIKAEMTIAKKEFEKVKKINTVASYEQFLSKYPRSLQRIRENI